MNEQIEKIYGEACIASGYLDEREFLQEFAKLIVRECAKIAKSTDPSDGDDYRSGRYWAGHDIKKHFGVEE